MTYRGRVKNGVIVLDPPVSLPEGEEVEIISKSKTSQGGPAEPVDSTKKHSLYDALKDLIGTVEGMPDDTSENLDHYLYGLPKK